MFKDLMQDREGLWAKSRRLRFSENDFKEYKGQSLIILLVD